MRCISNCLNSFFKGSTPYFIKYQSNNDREGKTENEGKTTQNKSIQNDFCRAIIGEETLEVF